MNKLRVPIVMFTYSQVPFFPMVSKRAFLFILFMALAMMPCFHSQALAEAPTRKEAIETFKQGAYPQAIDQFVQVLRHSPDDQVAHYYLGLCWHTIGKIPEAREEYLWVHNNSTNAELLKRADFGLRTLSRVSKKDSQPLIDYKVAEPPPQPQEAYEQSNYTAASFHNDSQTITPAETTAAHPRIIDLYTSWCGWCKVFEPTFKKAEAKYGQSIRFQRLNAEVEPNNVLAKKYHVRAYPTILMFDASGKLLKRIEGAPRNLAEFENEIWRVFPSVKPAGDRADGTN